MAPPTKYVVSPGQRLGRLVVIEEVHTTTKNDLRKVRAARCRCDCGKETVVTVYHLLGSRQPSRSCGCAVDDARRERNHRHGLAMRPESGRHPLYNTWHAMIYRCDSPKSPSYQWYGAKGVGVHPAWRDPAVFIGYIENVLGPRPRGYTLDRIDPSGDYEPGNVRWADASTQTLNRRNKP